ncbi:MAG: RMD1 family protein [Caedimonas sp.]|nr:RMD1 family protein [Caedimonas sp.]
MPLIPLSASQCWTVLTSKNKPPLIALKYNFIITLSVFGGLQLVSFEARIEAVIEGVEKITAAMARQGKVPLSRREIGKKIGKLFFERNLINLHSNFLNPPDFFWEYPQLEPLYQMTAKDLEIRSRTQTLNRKLDIMHDLYQILGDELNHRHTAKLEWIIIILIMIEVLLAIMTKIELLYKF